jgi:ribulose-phosphate 3-epimerase
MMEIIPAILEHDLKSVLEKIEVARSLGVEIVQLDKLDGLFANNTSFAEPDHRLASCRMRLEIHLMVRDSIAQMARWRRLRNVERVIIHREAIEEKILRQRYFLSLALNPETPISSIDQYLKRIKHVLFMGVQPGWSGQKFDHSVLKKIKAFRALEGTEHITVGADGCVNRDTAPLLKEAGVDILNVASFLWQGDTKANYEWLKSL